MGKSNKSGKSKTSDFMDDTRVKNKKIPKPAKKLHAKNKAFDYENFESYDDAIEYDEPYAYDDGDDDDSFFFDEDSDEDYDDDYEEEDFDEDYEDDYKESSSYAN